MREFLKGAFDIWPQRSACALSRVSLCLTHTYIHLRLCCTAANGNELIFAMQTPLRRCESYSCLVKYYC